MAKRDPNKYVEITPKNETSKAKLSYHGKRWVLRGEKQEARLMHSLGPHFIIRSIDGTKCMFVAKTNDPDYSIRFLG